MKNPLVSIIMPIRNEAKTINQTIKSVLEQDFGSKNLEIIVADGMSTDGTCEVIKRFQIKHSNLFLLHNEGKIVPTGINSALRYAKGKIIIRIDGHTKIGSDYVRQCVEALQRSGADNAGGRMTATGEGAFGETVAIATSSPFGVGGARFHYSDQEEWVDTVYLGAWYRDVFDRIGLFDEELVRDQDDEFNYRLREHGGKILLSPKIKSKYTVRSNPRALWRQYFQYGFWKVRVLQKHPRQMCMRQFIPPLFVASLIISTMLTMLYPITWFLLGLIFGTYALANLGASIYTSSKKGWKHLLLLPIVYAILHLSYGSGFLTGLVKFANRWNDKQGQVPSLEPARN